MKPSINADSLLTLQNTCHELIPLSRAMEVSMDSYNGQMLQVSAPLARNISHQLTAFGGSLYALAAIGGWGLLHLKFSELDLDCDTVIVNANANYYLPVETDLVCHCSLAEDSERVFNQLRESGKVTATTVAEYRVGDETAMSVTGTYHIRMRPS